jgi:hypothetical protein
MKAMSYFTSSEARQGWYVMRPKVEMPEKTESAYVKSIGYFTASSSFSGFTNLGATISWQSIIPKTLVWSRDWLLMVVLVTVGLDNSSKTGQQKF